MTAPGGSTWRDWLAGKVLPLAFWSLLLGSEAAAVYRRGAALLRPGIERGSPLELIRHLLTLGFFVLVLLAYLTRSRAVARARGFRERVLPMLVFLAGPLGIALLQRFRPPRSIGGSGPGIVVAVAGLGVSLWALWHLKASFSILAEARRPVTSGPYRFVRHPLYLGEALTMLGLCLLLGGPAPLLFWAAFNSLQLVRARIEEDKLARQFPDYRVYRERTRFILPGLY